jgi:hydroxymethylbilane synthase
VSRDAAPGAPVRPERVRIATRASALALWQARWVAARLEALGVAAELVEVTTQGDADDRPFAQIRGVGFFTKAVQDAVVDGRADVAVHSFKDLPSAPAPGLEVAAVPPRADPREVLLIRPEAFREDAPFVPLREGATIGTSAARRRAQLAWHRADLRSAELRGNVPTRIERLREGRYDAIVLAAAGLERLELTPEGLETVVLDPARFVPAPAQGALALEIRRGDDGLASLLTELHDVRGYPAVAAERGLMAMIQGGCQLALGAHAQAVPGGLRLHAWYEGRGVQVEHPSAEGAAMLAFDGLGRPDPASEREAGA